MQKAVIEWLKIADSDYEDAMTLLRGKRYSGVLFHLQQAVEKGLKAAAFIKSGDIPPKSHDLLQLLKNTDLAQNEVDFDALKKLSLSYVRLRYPDLDTTYYTNKKLVMELINFAQDLYLWIKKQLEKN